MKTTVFLRHMGDYDVLNEVWAGPLRRPPARPGPPSPSASCPLHALVEVEAWAYTGP